MPAYYRNFPIPAKLDLWLLRFSQKEDIPRATIMRDALTRFLKKFAPECEPSEGIHDILRERWNRREKPGKYGVEFEDSQPLKIQIYSESKDRSKGSSAD